MAHSTAAYVAAGALGAAALAAWCRCRDRPNLASLPLLPEALLRSLRDLDAVVVLGESFGQARTTVLHAALSRVSPAVPGAPAVLRALEERPGDLELLVGDAAEALGQEPLRRLLRSQVRARPPALLRRLARLEDVPFTAVLASCWDEVLWEAFPCRVGRNFGGFSTVLSRPRVDRPPGSSRPILPLFPSLDDLPSSREESRRFLAADAPYATFLRDLLQSKVVLLLGWVAPPQDGHFGAALAQAWEATRRRDAKRTEPLAYAVVPTPSAECRAECLQRYGLALLGYDHAVLGESALEHFLWALAEECKARVDS